MKRLKKKTEETERRGRKTSWLCRVESPPKVNSSAWPSGRQRAPGLLGHGGRSSVRCSGSLKRCPLIFPCCLTKESYVCSASGKDGISDSDLLGFLDGLSGMFWEKTLQHTAVVQHGSRLDFCTPKKACDGKDHTPLHSSCCLGLSFCDLLALTDS